MPAATIMLVYSLHMYWQPHEALGLEAAVAGKGPTINIKHNIFLKTTIMRY
jgi:hypothetical protein